MKRIVLILLFAFSALLNPSTGFAQQERMFSQYMFNGLFLNPAYAGSHKYWQATGIYRAQWVGFEGAPRTSMVGIDGILKNKVTGLGFILSNDRIGVTENNEITGNYAHHVKLGRGHLSLGIRAGVSAIKAPLTSVTVWDNNDAAFASDLNYFMIPRAGFGGFYYTDKWYAGLAIPTLLVAEPGKSFNMNINQFNTPWRHYFLNAGAVFTLDNQWKMKPSMLLKYVRSAPPELDLNISLMYRDRIWVAASFRTGDAVVLLTEYQANMRFRIGYAYDITISKLARYSNGTHEIMIGYDFVKEKNSAIKFF